MNSCPHGKRCPPERGEYAGDVALPGPADGGVYASLPSVLGSLPAGTDDYPCIDAK